MKNDANAAYVDHDERLRQRNHDAGQLIAIADAHWSALAITERATVNRVRDVLRLTPPPEVIACMGSVLACQKSGCQARVLKAQIEAQMTHVEPYPRSFDEWEAIRYAFPPFVRAEHAAAAERPTQAAIKADPKKFADAFESQRELIAWLILKAIPTLMRKSVARVRITDSPVDSPRS